MQAIVTLKAGWRDPVEVLGGFAEEPFAVAFLSGGGGPRARWSFLARDPDALLVVEPGSPLDPFEALVELLGPRRPSVDDGPPFQGGVAGLACYELAARLERDVMARDPDWPDLICARYPAVLAFDHERRDVVAIGRGETDDRARTRAEGALGWIGGAALPAWRGPLADGFEVGAPSSAYEAAVAEVVERIGDGEIFQANIARTWTGRLSAGARPYDLLVRLARTSPAPFAGYFRAPGRGLASNSPERFVQVRHDGDGLRAETRPIKGTRPRGRTAAEDDRLAADLLASEKDRAENLMIVDLMRNDLARVCRPVQVDELFRVERFANVQHLVSTVSGRLRPPASAIDLFKAAFPPGSITGAPKIQAMKVIGQLEAPRGPYCGSLFWAGFDGAFDSSVLIRTAAMVEDAGGWRFTAPAGAGIVADSNPELEARETESKIAALQGALMDVPG